MRQVKLTKARQERFLQALADTGSVTTAVAVAGTSRTRVYELRSKDTAFATAWEEAEEIATDMLEDEARRRAIEGIAEPLVSGGKLVRGDDGQPVVIRRYSDNLLLALLKLRRLPRRGRSGRFQLPAVRFVADVPSAMTAITAAVGAGELTLGEAVELSELVMVHMNVLKLLRLESPPISEEEMQKRGEEMRARIERRRIEAYRAANSSSIDVSDTLENGMVRRPKETSAEMPRRLSRPTGRS